MERLNSERLILRRFTHDDWKDLYEYLSNPDIVSFEPYDIFSENDCIREVAARSIGGKRNKFWAVCLTETNKLIGQIFFDRIEQDIFFTWEIGYVFNPLFHGKGYATEACNRILEYGFQELHAHRVIAQTDTRNYSSWKVLERLNMRREGHMIKNVFFKKDNAGTPLWKDTYQYAILSEEWTAKK